MTAAELNRQVFPPSPSRAWVHGLISEAMIAARLGPVRRVIVSYPKSGGTWLNYMLARTAAAGAGREDAGQTIELARLRREVPSVPRIRWTHDGAEIVNEAGRHPDPWPLFAYDRRLAYLGRDVLLLIRDPRDVVVSYYHQATRRSARPLDVGSMSDFIRHPLYGIARVVRFYRIWHANLHVPRRLEIVRYEDLLREGPERLLRVARFLGIPCSLTHAQQAFEQARAETMRELEKKGAIAGMRRFGDEPNALKVRKGRAGGFAEEMSEEDIAFCAEAMSGLPPAFRYG